MAARVNPTGELPEAMDPISAGRYLDARDGFVAEYGGWQAGEQTLPPGPQLVGCFLVDRAGIVRWTFFEGAAGPSGFGSHPDADEISAAVSSLAA
jgi:hypothetical protein